MRRLATTLLRLCTVLLWLLRTRLLSLLLALLSGFVAIPFLCLAFHDLFFYLISLIFVRLRQQVAAVLHRVLPL